MARDFPVYSADTTLGWRVVIRITREQGERMVEQGSAYRVEDSFGKHIGYQKAGAPQVSDKALPSLASSASITARESEANAGVCGESLTENMREDKRVNRLHSRTGKVLPAEDMVERARAKVAAFNPRTWRDSMPDVKAKRQ
jgi:hypothetical protein